MKKIISLLLCLVFVFSCSTTVFAAEQPIKVKVCNYTNPNGKWTSEKYIKFDVQPQIINGRTMVPIRAVAEELGYDVSWNAKTQTVSIKDVCCLVKDGNNCSLYTNYNQQKCIMNLWYNIEAKNTTKFSALKKDSTNFCGTNEDYKSMSLGYFFDNAKHFRTSVDFKIKSSKANLSLYDEYMTDHAVVGVPGFYRFKFYSTYTLDSPAVIIKDRTLVPLRAAAEMLGLDVSWNDSTRTVTITA